MGDETQDIREASAAHAAAWTAGRLPAPERAADDVWVYASPIPAGSIPYTLSYLLASANGDVHLIDPGWDDDRVLDALRDALEAAGRSLEDVRTVIATHFHPDHLGIAGRLRELTGARVVISGVERQVLAQETSIERRDRVAYALVLDGWGVPLERRDELARAFDRPALVADVTPDRTVSDGELLELPDHRLVVVATAGHTDGHICLADDDRRIVYTGDHVLPTIFPGIGIGTLPGSDALTDYLDSLARLEPLDEYEVFPGHEFGFTGLRARRMEIARHHLRRTAEVVDLVPELGDAPVWEYARRLTWTAGWDGMRGFWLHSGLRQTALHLELARSGRAAGQLARLIER